MLNIQINLPVVRAGTSPITSATTSRSTALWFMLAHYPFATTSRSTRRYPKEFIMSEMYNVSYYLWAVHAFTGTQNFEKLVWHSMQFDFRCSYLKACLNCMQLTLVTTSKKGILHMIWPSQHFTDKTSPNVQQASKAIFFCFAALRSLHFKSLTLSHSFGLQCENSQWQLSVRIFSPHISDHSLSIDACDIMHAF